MRGFSLPRLQSDDDDDDDDVEAQFHQITAGHLIFSSGQKVFPEESDGLKLRDHICRKVCAFPQLASASSRNLFCRYLDVFFRGVAAAASYVSETAAPPPPHNLEQILWLLLRGLKYGVIAKTTLSRHDSEIRN